MGIGQDGIEWGIEDRTLYSRIGSGGREERRGEERRGDERRREERHISWTNQEILMLADRSPSRRLGWGRK